MPSVFGWSAGSDGCEYYRMALPFAQLAAQGWETAISELIPADVRAGSTDVIVGQRVCQPGPSQIWQQMCREGKSLMVFETDDLLDGIEPDNKGPYEFFTPEVIARYHRNIEMADVVTTTTEPLAEHLAQFNPNVKLIPNMVPGWLLDHEHAQTDRLTIGWRGGASHSRDFGELAAPLRRFLQHPTNRDRVEFHCVGADHSDRVASRHAVTRYTDWFKNTADFLKAVDFDLGVIPLRPSTFNSMKSDVALLEYSALGIPAIASAFGPYQRARNAGGWPVALLAGRARDWEQNLRHLVDEREMRAEQGKQAQEWAATRTIESNVWRWVEAYS